MSEDKKIKLSFAVDDASLAKAEAGLSRLIALTSKLADGMRGVHFPGAPGGSGQGGILDSVHVRGGPTPVGTSQNQNPVAAASSRLTGALTDQKNILTSLAKGSADAMRLIGDSFKRTIESQKNSLASLKSAAKDLQSTYDDLSSLKAPTPTESAMRDRMGAKWIEKEGQVRSKEDEIRETKRQHRALTAEDTIVDPTAPSKPGGGGLLDKLAMGAMGFGTVNRILNAGSQIAGMMGTAGVMYGQNIMAGRGQAWGGLYSRAYSGDITAGAQSMFLGGRFSDAGSRRMYAGIDEIRNSRGADLMGSVFDNTIGLMGGNVNAVQKAEWAKESTEVQRQKMMMAIADNWAGSAGKPFMTNVAAFQADAGNRMSFERQIGYGGKFVNDAYKDSANDTILKLTQAGILASEYGPAAEAMRAAGARGGAGTAAGGTGAGGAWAGLGTLGAAAAIGGASNDFMRGVVGFSDMGMEPAGAMSVGSAIAGTLGVVGGHTFTGLETLAAFQAGFGPMSGSESNLMFGSMVSGGLKAAGSSWGGDRSSYQKSINFMNAGKAFGTNDMVSQGHLASMFSGPGGANLAISYASGSVPIPESLKAQGVTSEKVMKYLKLTDASLFNQAAMRLTPGTEGNARALSLNGQFHGDLRAATAGMSATDRTNFIKTTAEAMAPALNMDVGDLTGLMVADWALGEPSANLRKGGRGAPGSASRTLALTQQGQHAEQTANYNQDMASILDSVKVTKDVVKGLGELVTSLDSSGGKVVAVFDAVADKIAAKFGIKLASNPHGATDDNNKQKTQAELDAQNRYEAARRALGH